MKDVIEKVIFYALSFVAATLFGLIICLGLNRVWELIDSNEVTEIQQAQAEEMKPIQVTTDTPKTPASEVKELILSQPSSGISFIVDRKTVIEFTSDDQILWYRGDKVIVVDRETTLVRALRCYMSKLANVAELSGCHCCKSQKGCQIEEGEVE